MTYSCSASDCTVGVTGKCLLSHSPVDSCPNVLTKTLPQGTTPESAVITTTTTVYHGNELGLQQAAAIMSRRYGWLVGVLGAYDTGKTCLLSSLYLLASCGELRPSFLFAGSLTLPGFESRLRLLRKWSGTRLPEQIVDHTVLKDDRQPGLMHLTLMQTCPRPVVRELFFTDLPGEWTTDLIKRSDKAERLQFLRRADSIVITFPAPRLLAPESRNSEIQSGRILLQRLRDSVGIDRNLPVVLAITRCDLTGVTTPPAIYQLVDVAQQLGFVNVSHQPIAAFSDRRDVPSGLGVATLLETILQDSVQRVTNPPQIKPSPRMFARVRFSLESQP